MQAINHALTGAIIGLTVSRPVIAIPAAVVSHVVCDVIPHFGGIPRWEKTKFFKIQLLIDASLCVLLVAVLFIAQPAHWFLASICAFAATAPDLLWARGYMHTLRGEQYKQNRLEKFLSDIQWLERPIGALVEIVWFVASLMAVGLLTYM